MKFYVKQKIFSLNDKYEIFDEGGVVKYYVDGALFSIGSKFKMFDSNDNLLYEIHQKVLSFLPKYILLKDGNEIASIKKNLTLFRDNYTIEQLGWNITGDLWAHNYEIVCNGNIIASIKKEWFSFGDAYEFEINNANDVELVLAVIIMIDKMLDADSQNDNLMD